MESQEGNALLITIYLYMAYGPLQYIYIWPSVFYKRQHTEKARECEHRYLEVCYGDLTATVGSITHLEKEG